MNSSNPYALDGFGEGFERGLRIVNSQQDRQIRQQELERQHKREDVSDAAAAEKFSMEKQDYTDKKLSDLEQGALEIHKQYKNDPEGEMKALAPLNENLKKYNGGKGFEYYAGPDAANYLDKMGKVAQGQLDMNDPDVLNAANKHHESDLNQGLGPVNRSSVTPDGIVIDKGDIIDNKRIKRIVAGPNGTVGFDLEVTGHKKDGTQFTYEAPLTEGRQNLGKGDNVKLIPAHRVFDHIQGDAIMRQVATSPGFGDALKASYVSHGGKIKDLEGKYSSALVPVGNAGEVETRAFNEETGEYGPPIARGTRYGLSGAGGASGKQERLIQFLAKNSSLKGEDPTVAIDKATEIVLGQDKNRFYSAVYAANLRSGQFNTPEEAKADAEQQVNDRFANNPKVPETEKSKEERFPPSWEGKIVRKNGVRAMVVNGKPVPLDQVPKEAVPGIKPKAADSETQRKINIASANLDAAKQAMRIAEQRKDISSYRHAQKQMEDATEEIRGLTLK